MSDILIGGAAVVFSEDAAKGHIQAEHIGELGARYILSEGYYTMEEIFQAVCNQAGIKAPRPSVLSGWTAMALSMASEAWSATVTGRPPVLPKGQLRLLESRIMPSSSFSERSNSHSEDKQNHGGKNSSSSTKASDFLGWLPQPFYEGLQVTLDFFAHSGLLREK